MDQSINIPFSIRLGPEDSSFQITIDQKFLNNPDRLFGFATVTLTPDYYSQKAFQLDLDSTEELQAPIEEEFSLETYYEDGSYDSRPYNPSSVPNIPSAFLKSLNTHFQAYKPSGCILPLVVFDWIHVGVLGNANPEEFYQSKHDDLYENEDDERHGTYLPSVFRGKLGLNDRALPNKNEIFPMIRIRMTLAPNVTVAFSNTNLPLALGFSPQQLSVTYRNQIRIANINSTSFKTIICQQRPTLEEVAYTTKIQLYPTLKVVVLNGILKTTLERQKKLVGMATDYGNDIANIAKQLNLELLLEHKVSEKKFTFKFPNEAKIKMSIRLPSYIASKLGYGHVNVIKSDATSTAYEEETELDNVDSISKVLVYDTGMVVISLDQLGSQQTHQFTNTVMAILESDPAGILTTKPGIEFPRVPVSQFNPKMEFILYKYNEANYPISLGWKVGCFIRGLLVGKV